MIPIMIDTNQSILRQCNQPQPPRTAKRGSFTKRERKSLQETASNLDGHRNIAYPSWSHEPLHETLCSRLSKTRTISPLSSSTQMDRLTMSTLYNFTEPTSGHGLCAQHVRNILLHSIGQICYQTSFLV